MALADFDNETLNKLRGLLGTFGNEKINSLVRKSTTYIESQYFEVTDKVTITNNGGDDTFEYKAKEVLIDGSEVEIGITFDSDETGTGKVDETIFLPNLKFPSNFTGEVEVGKIYQVDAVEPDGFEEKTQYYIIPKGGGGSMLYAYIKSGSSNKYTVDVYSQPTLDDKFKVDEDIEALAYNVTYGDISHNNFLIFSYGIDESSGTDGYLTSSVWL